MLDPRQGDRRSVPAAHPRSFSSGELKALGPQMYKQEFGCEFVADDESVFSHAL